ncbi:small acid-soluble spore protein N [Texcoconibacillus texcoconensis]|uniref:Small acid-soluble spore protein N (Minor) n=1 Tax=Texcoconibacillus texcoconensis TaxID=1095777 RepID=A0A840QSH3_9BACI|nr:small acid-soluble spore protein N [Texcoconibacillus texcoconensis]MBB5174466.1 small acid-soluble spore protein N (minor) [Texcoconibacillus texcoconensis]
MSSQNKSARYRPDHPGTQPVKSDLNKGKKMAMKSNEKPNYIPTHGE